jgi:hypothetical protein
MRLKHDLFKQLEALPESEILGVVSADGVSRLGTGPSSVDIQWTVAITVSGWKPFGGKLRKSELTVSRSVPEAAVLTAIPAVNPYDVLRVRVRWPEDKVSDSPRALLIEVIGREDSDFELNSYASELQEPVTFEDPQFGLFTLDRGLDWYAATPDWCGGTIQLTIPASAPGELEKSLMVARRLWAEQEDWQRKTASCAVNELLRLKNASWLGEDEDEVNEEEFAQRMVLESISVEADGSFQFWHDDGELFLGHSIMVRGNLTNGPTDAGIHG